MEYKTYDEYQNQLREIRDWWTDKHEQLSHAADKYDLALTMALKLYSVDTEVTQAYGHEPSITGDRYKELQSEYRQLAGILLPFVALYAAHLEFKP